MKIISLPMFRSLVFGSTMLIDLVEMFVAGQDPATEDPDYTFALADRVVVFRNRTYLSAGFNRPQIRESLQDGLAETSLVLPDVGRAIAIMLESADLGGSRVMLRQTTEARRQAGESTLRYDGKINTVTVQGGSVSFALTPLVGDMNSLRVVPARGYTVDCEYRFGDPHTCTFDLAGYTVDCEVGPGSNRLRLMAAAVTAQQAARGWNPSAVKFVSGINSGQQRPVSLVRDGMVVLRKPFYTSPAQGDRFKLVRQCPKTGQACNDDFENYPNFGGHEYVPRDPRTIVRNNPQRI